MAVHSRSFAALDPFEKSLELFSNLNTINFWENFCWIEFLEIEYKKNFFPTSKNIQIRIYNLIINYSNIQILSPVYFPYRKKKVKKSTFSNVTFRICKTSLLPNWREGGFLLIDDSQTSPLRSKTKIWDFCRFMFDTFENVEKSNFRLWWQNILCILCHKSRM